MCNGALAPPDGQPLFNTTDLESPTLKFGSFLLKTFVMFLKEVSKFMLTKAENTVNIISIQNNFYLHVF